VSDPDEKALAPLIMSVMTDFSGAGFPHFIMAITLNMLGTPVALLSETPANLPA
jgi:hypothetical protein